MRWCGKETRARLQHAKILFANGASQRRIIRILHNQNFAKSVQILSEEVRERNL